MLDFIIFIEHQTRELENAVLLSIYLKKQGYTVEVLRIDTYKMLYKRAKVVIVPYAYNNDDVFSFVSFPFCSPKVILNMQYEQIYTELDEKTEKFIPKDIAQRCHIVIWGNHSYNNLIKAGISKYKLHKVGNIALDFNSSMFSDYFKTKQELSKEYSLPYEKNWHLFISSFSFNNISSEQKKDLKRFIVDIDDRIDIGKKSQQIIVNWFEEYLNKNDDTCIIYRPHPSEVVSDDILGLSQSNSNFHIINDYSIRQWIKVSDTISNWYSTSMADIYYQRKSCVNLRPITIPSEIDMVMLKDSVFISNYNDFENYLKEDNNGLFVKQSEIQEFYYNSFDGNSHEILGDLCIELLNEKDSCNYKLLLGFSRGYFIKRYIWLFLMFFASHFDFSKVVPLKYRTQLYYVYKESINLNKNITILTDRMSRVIDDNKKI